MEVHPFKLNPIEVNPLEVYPLVWAAFSAEHPERL
jgi:hypothetical protein